MFVYSKDQFHKLMKIDINWKRGSMIDLGAGDGKVTAVMADSFHKVYATEMSTQMQKHLEHRGYQIINVDNWTEHSYDVISCLNLLDRCDKPMTLLRDMKTALNPDGYAIVASVFPYSPYVEVNTASDFQPTEKLHITSRSIEEHINQLVKQVFTPCGFSLHSVSRVPYLCEGDLTTSFYVLHDVVFVLRPN